MAIKRIIILIALLACAVPSFAQTTSVSATAITDAAGVVWKNGTFNFQFVPSPVNPFGPYFQGGAPFNTSQVVAGSLDNAGSFTQAVPDNKTITPAGSGWKFTVCPAATAPCSTFTFTITGASQVLSVTPPAIVISMSSPPNGAAAYTDGEVIGARQGQFYFNLTDNTLHMCSLPVCTWLSLASPASILPLNNAFTGSNTMGKVNAVRYVDGVQFATIDAAITDCGSVNPCQIFVPSTYAGTFPPVNPITNNIYITDYHAPGPSAPLALGTGDAMLSQTPNVFSFLRHSSSPIAPLLNKSYELTTNVVSFTGAFPNSNQSLEGITSSANSLGAISTPSTTNLLGGESNAQVQSTGGTIANLIGWQSAVRTLAGSTTNVTNMISHDMFGPSIAGGGTVTNAYGLRVTQGSNASSRSYALFNRGNALFSDPADIGGSFNIDFTDHTGTAKNFISYISPSDNIIDRTMGGTRELRAQGVTAAIWRFSSPFFAFDPDNNGYQVIFGTSSGWKFAGGGTSLTGVTGSGSNVVTDVGPTIASPVIKTGISTAAPSAGSTGFQHIRVTGCATAAALNSTCDTTITWTAPFANASYTATCTGEGVTSGVPIVEGEAVSGAKTGTAMTVRTLAITAAAAQFTQIDCTAVHD